MSVYYNDIDPYACAVLRKNIERGHLPQGTVDERDIRTIDFATLRGYQHIHLFAGIGGFPLGFEWAGVPRSIRLITGGFPCQDISAAGQQAGIDGARSGLWANLCHAIGVVRPDYAVMENVAALISGGNGRWMGRILGDLAEIGYDCEWHCIPAVAIGAPHKRDRLFLIAYPGGKPGQRGVVLHSVNGFQRNQEWCTTQNIKTGRGWKRWLEQTCADLDRKADNPWFCRVDDGVSQKLDRFRGLGNAIVPQMAHLIGLRLIAHHRAHPHTPPSASPDAPGEAIAAQDGESYT